MELEPEQSSFAFEVVLVFEAASLVVVAAVSWAAEVENSRHNHRSRRNRRHSSRRRSHNSHPPQ